MKTIVLFRHAEAESYKSSVADLHRKLTDFGIDNCKKIAKKLNELKVFPDLIISSPALRTQHTAQIFASELGYQTENIYIENFLYENYDKGDVVNLLLSHFEDKNTVFIVGHNPLISFVAGEFTGNYYQFPSGKVLGILFDSKNWELKHGKEIFSFQPEL